VVDHIDRVYENVDIRQIIKHPTDESELVEPMTINVPDTLADQNDVDPQKVEVADQSIFPLDTTALEPLEARIMLHYPDDDRSVLHPFFEALTKAKQGKRTIRVVHYGDSQLVGDSNALFLRN